MLRVGKVIQRPDNLRPNVQKRHVVKTSIEAFHSLLLFLSGQELYNNGYQDLNRDDAIDRPYAVVDTEYENPI